MTTPSIDEIFRAALNRHGYGFQYALLNEAQRLFRSGRSRWIPWVPEFPVHIQGHGTRVDLILRYGNSNYYIVAECKRANPATANWCFARAWQPDKSAVAKQSYVEVAYWYDEEGRCETGLKNLVVSERIFQIALEVRTGSPGNEGGKGRGEIEEAATQVCRGLNGFIQVFHDRRSDLLKMPAYVGFIPVVFTTAKLLATTTELSSADLGSGDIGEFSSALEEKDWLWYDYPQSPGLKHSIPPSGKSSDLREVLFQDYIRRIAIVNPSGLEAIS